MVKQILCLFILIILPDPRILAQEIETKTDTNKTKKITVYKVAAYTSAYYAGSMYVLGNTWYKDKARVPFHFYNDTRAYLQVDKFGHMFGSYVYSYIGYQGMLKLGTTRNEALLFGSTLGFVLQFPIEIMDGKHEGYGFSWSDIGANALGSFIVCGQELLFKEQVIKCKFSYSELSYSDNSKLYYGETTIKRFFKDYNAHTYWFSMPINKIVLKQQLPPWFSFAVGYGANGMYGEFENALSYNGIPIPETERNRQYLLSLDIEWTKINTNSKFLKALFKGMTFIKLPFPTIEYNSKGQFKGYWIYY